MDGTETRGERKFLGVDLHSRGAVRTPEQKAQAELDQIKVAKDTLKARGEQPFTSEAVKDLEKQASGQNFDPEDGTEPVANQDTRPGGPPPLLRRVAGSPQAPSLLRRAQTGGGGQS